MARLPILFEKPVLRALAAVLAMAAIAGCSAGRTPQTDTQSPTFVSLNPCLDAILVEVAEPAQILALSHYSHDPSASSIDQERARKFAVTGGTVEEIIALDPDIVLGSTFMAPATINALERMGQRVETFGSPVTVEQSLRQIRALSNMTGREELGYTLIERIESSLRMPEASNAISTLLWQPGQIVPGETTLIGEVLRRSGFQSHSAARGLGQGDYVALETVLADPPELLLVAGDNQGQRHPMLAQMETTQVETLDPGLLYCGGPTIIKLRERLETVRSGRQPGPRR